MKKKHAFRKSFFITLFFYLVSFNLGIGQQITFNIDGTNPHCFSDYNFPNGVNYNGTIYAPSECYGGFTVTVQMQREGTTASWQNWGNSFVISPQYPSNQTYNQSTSNAPVLNMTPTNNVRMKATYQYRTSQKGSMITTVVYSNEVQFNYFPAPTLTYTVGGLQGSPTIPITLYLCDPISDEINWVAPSEFEGTGLQWKFKLYTSSSDGTIIDDISGGDCWANGSPPISISRLYPMECWRPTLVNPGYYIFKLIVKNDCGTTEVSTLVHYLEYPSGSAVDFGFGGSLNADAYASYGAGTSGSSETLGLGESDSDAFLSWGGTESDPTWVGAYSIYLSNANYTNLYGSLLSYTVKVEDISGTPKTLGEVTNSGIIPTTFSLNTDIALADIGTPALLFFYNNYANLTNHEFKVTLTGHGVCDQNPSKSGYFRLIPGHQSWKTGNLSSNTAINLLDPHEINEDWIKDVNLQNKSYTNGINSIDIFPNPIKNNLTLQFVSNQNEQLDYDILNSSGQVLKFFSSSINAIVGVNQIQLDLSDLNSGLYYIQIKGANTLINEKFIKLD